MATANQLVNQAKSWLGKNENDGSFKVIIDTYNAHKPLARSYKVKYTDEWCATFISALVIKCGATDIIPTECSCEKMIGLMKSKGMWQENENITPKVGWIIFYDWDDSGSGDNKGWSDHVGIVEKVSGSTITVIEGNISRKVGRRNIKVNGKFIRGYGKPNYKAESKPTPPQPSKPKDEVELYSGRVTSKINGLAYHSSPSWSSSTVVGRINKGQYFDVVGKIKVEGVYMYKTKEGYYITSAHEYVTFSTGKPSTPKPSIYYKRYTGKSNSIVDGLVAIGVNSSYSYRAKIAKANGIKGYVGLPSQNTKMLNLLKAGKLIKA